jgi:hypothetical protein
MQQGTVKFSKQISQCVKKSVLNFHTLTGFISHTTFFGSAEEISQAQYTEEPIIFHVATPKLCMKLFKCTPVLLLIVYHALSHDAYRQS